MIELSICIPTMGVYSEHCRHLVESAHATLGDFSYEIILVENSHPAQGVTDPINASIRAARGEYIAVVNDDVELLPGWWPALRRSLDSGAAVVMPFTEDKQRFGFWLFAMKAQLVEEFSVEPGEFWDRQFKLWFSDTDFLARLTTVQKSVDHVSESRINHAESLSHNTSDPIIAERIAEDGRLFYAKWPQD